MTVFCFLLLDALWCRKCENVFTLDDCTCSVECASGEVSTFYNYYFYTPSGGGVVDNTLDYQSRDREIDPLLHRPSDETLNLGPISVLEV